VRRGCGRVVLPEGGAGVDSRLLGGVAIAVVEASIERTRDGEATSNYAVNLVLISPV
jgi:hypothetical protein